jgi:hypothetical protein
MRFFRNCCLRPVRARHNGGGASDTPDTMIKRHHRRVDGFSDGLASSDATIILPEHLLGSPRPRSRRWSVARGTRCRPKPASASGPTASSGCATARSRATCSHTPVRGWHTCPGPGPAALAAAGRMSGKPYSICFDGQRVSEYEQNTQQSPGLGLSTEPHCTHS